MIDDSPSAIKGKVFNTGDTLFDTEIFYRNISGSKIYMDFSDLTTRNASRQIVILLLVLRGSKFLL